MITVISFSPAEGLRETDRIDGLTGLLQRRDAVAWIDFAAPTKEEAEILTDVFRFHPLAVEDCHARRHHPKVDDYRDYLFILTHGVHPESSMREFRTRQLAFFLGPNYLVTWHREKSRSVEHTLEGARRNPRIVGDGPSGLLYHILDYQVDQYLPVIENFEKRVGEIEEEIFRGPAREVLNDVLDLKRALMRLRRIAGHQKETLVRLIRREFPLIDERSTLHLRDVHDHLVRVTDLADTYRELVSSALEAHLSLVSNRTNEIMRALTIVATLFIPLTFITGFYGMNFEHLPGIRSEYGHLVIAGIMVAVAAGMYIFFRRRGVFPGSGR